MAAVAGILENPHVQASERDMEVSFRHPRFRFQPPELGYTARSLTLTMPGGDTVKLNSAAEAYGLAACIENMAARVWPDSKPGK